MLVVVVAVDWGNAAISAFSTKQAAERHLARQGLTKQHGDSWARCPADIEQGDYWSIAETIVAQ